ncbi:MAG: hypothetical protein HQL51_16555 [Magnetococcales bacterium]|nr:hypothetical protein [Magnetococcales bacterium]
MKLLHLPNEVDEADPATWQIGPRKALERLAREGVLSQYAAYSFLARWRQTRDAGKVQSELLALCEAMRPDILFWQHVSEFPLTGDFLDQLKARCRLLVYHEADIFDGLWKRPTPSMKVLFSRCDLALLVGLGAMAALARRHGARAVGYLPFEFDNVRFGRPWEPPAHRPHALVMIANNWRGRIPGWPLPGGRRRVGLARRLAEVFGESLALYGRGWEGVTGARGPLPFDQQERALREGWASINWDHYDDLPYYFSDRLPIALAAGVVHVTSRHPGYEFLFRDCPGLYAVPTVEEAVDCAEWLLHRPRRALIEEGLAAKAWVEANLEADVVYRHAVGLCAERLVGLPPRAEGS